MSRLLTFDLSTLGSCSSIAGNVSNVRYGKAQWSNFMCARKLTKAGLIYRTKPEKKQVLPNVIWEERVDTPHGRECSHLNYRHSSGSSAPSGGVHQIRAALE